MELNIKILGIIYFSFLIILTYIFNVYLCFINTFLFLSVISYVLSFIFFFYFLPVLFFKGPINLQKNFLEGLLLSQLYFMRETYIGGFTGKRKVFYYFTLIIGMVFLRVFDLYFIIISYFILVIFNTVVILFGSRKDSFIWNFYVNQLGYNKVVQIVGNPLSLLAKLGGKALLPKAGTVVKPLVKVGGGLIVFDVVVGDHFGLYDFTNACAYDLNHLRVTKLMSQNVPYDPPVWGHSKSIIRVICESSEGKELALDTIKRNVK